MSYCVLYTSQKSGHLTNQDTLLSQGCPDQRGFTPHTAPLSLLSLLVQLQCSKMDADPEGEEKCRQISQRIADLTSYLAHIDHTSYQYQMDMKKDLLRQCQLWEVELRSGGNVKFSPGGPEDRWYNSCVQLVKSRFSAAKAQVLHLQVLHSSILKPVYYI